MNKLLIKSTQITDTALRLWRQNKKQEAINVINEQNQQLSTVVVAKLCCHLTSQEVYNLSLLLENKL